MGESREQSLTYVVQVSISSNFVKNSIEHTFLGNNELEEMAQMVNNRMNNLDNKKVNMKQFKFNFIFNDKGENFEELTERAFNNYCITRLENENIK